ncbi:MAG: 2-oxoacid:ferredoxin oxidoreductase subunit beta [Ignavibacteria bacterium]|nr:2-oxoacid:ferredoxin oxidoreductase subunit beta [Ignavibacteria bacterium]
MTTMLQDIVVKRNVPTNQYTPKDFKVDIDVRWCAGCGGYSILSQVQRIMPELGVPREKIVFVSGIGCSSRFPYYINVYGFHSIHGRALAVASGLKIARPDLSVWIATGDGDCMSIGGNHFIHACRRNVDINVLMFNNEVYSLTKGQYSPTSQPGQKTKTSPFGVVDDPFNPASLALGAGATFVARGYDRDPKMLQYLFERAAAHKGISFVEIYANCVIFNDGAFDKYTEKEYRDDTTVWLEDGKPLIFGKNRDKGIILDGFTPVVVSFEDGKYSPNDVLVHNEKDSTLAFILANMTYNPDVPRPIGVFQSIDKPSYEEKVDNQIEEVTKKLGEGDINKLMRGEDFWTID